MTPRVQALCTSSVVVNSRSLRNTWMYPSKFLSALFVNAINFSSNTSQCLIEIPSYMGMDALEAYAEDPNVKFILTERNPDKWVASVNNTVAVVVRMANSFRFAFLKYFDPILYRFLQLNQTMYWAFSDGTNPGEPDNESALRRNYVE